MKTVSFDLAAETCAAHHRSSGKTSIVKMKIGLVRHFKVNHPFPDKFLMSRQDVIKWFEDYDQSQNFLLKDVDLGDVAWTKCYASTMLRAIHTAKHIYPGNIEQVDQLKEFDILHTLPGKVRLPFLVWGTIVRIKSMSRRKETERFANDIETFVDSLLEMEHQNILIVSHWFVMRIIRNQLIRRGFQGPGFKSNDYGKLYLFEDRNPADLQDGM